MRFTHDVFVSHAWNDGTDRIQELVEDLRKALAPRIKRPPSIAFDAEFRPSEEFEPAIEKKIGNSALMISLISPTYLDGEQHPFCYKEIKWFCEKSAQEPWGLTVNDRRRIVNVQLFALEPENWYPELKGANPHKFFFLEGTIDRPLRRSHGEQYLKRIDELAKDLSEILNDMELDALPDRLGAGESEGGLMVYVARAPNDEVPQFQKVVNELRRVVKNMPVTVSLVTWEDYKGPPELREPWTRKAVNRATVSVHLLSGLDHPGVRDNLRLGLGARAHQIIWAGFAPGSGAPTNPYRTQIESFRNGPGAPGPEKVIDDMITTRSEAASTIGAQVRRWIEAAIPPRELTVCIDLGESDRAAADAAKFFAYLQECGIQPFGSTADPEDFRTQIPRSKGVVVFYGDAQQDWVAASFNKAMNIVAGRQRRLDTWGVYYGEPKNDEKPARTWTQKLSLPIDLLEMNGMEGFREEIVWPLLAKLGVTPPSRKAPIPVDRT